MNARRTSAPAAFAAARTALFLLTLFLLTVVASGQAGASKKPAVEVREGLLLEANVKQGRDQVSGRVLLQSGETVWTLVASKAGNERQAGLRLEARAVMLEPDVVEIETRITGSTEENAKMIVRLGELANLNVAQMEGATESVKGGKNRPETSLGVRVLKVRF